MALVEKPSTAEASSTYGALPPLTGLQSSVLHQLHAHERSNLKLYFAVLCVATMSRIFESGLLYADMPSVQKSLYLDYSSQGIIASCIDYGLLPGAVFAYAVFAWVRARLVIVLLLLGAGGAMIYCALLPTFATLVINRAVSGMCWAPVAVHCTVWINARAPDDRRGMWMGLVGVALIAGQLLGFGIGCLFTNWTAPYEAAGWCVIICAICISYFPESIIQVEAPVPSVLDLQALFQSRLCWAIIGWSSCVNGLLAFFLYFGMHLGERGGLSLHGRQLTLIVFMVSAIPAVMIGAYCMDQFGGYRNFRASFAVLIGCSTLYMLFTFGFYLSLCYKWSILFLLMLYSLSIAGAFPVSAINGMVTSVVPGTSYFATGLQLAMQNAACLFVPQLGGLLCDHFGIALGCFIISFGTMSVGLLCALVGYHHACSGSEEQAAADCLLTECF